MTNFKENIKKYGQPIYIVWSCISLILIVAVLVVNFCFEKPLTNIATYFNVLNVTSKTEEGDIVENEVPIIKVNVTRSKTNPDLTLTELVLGTYTDYQGNDYNQFAIQLVGENFKYFCPAGKTYDTWDTLSSKLVDDNGNEPKAYYYQIDSNGNPQPITRTVFEEAVSHMYLPAGDDMFRLQLGGEKGAYIYKNLTYDYDNYWNWYAETFNITTYAERIGYYNIFDLYFDLVKRSMTDTDSSVTKQLKNVDLNRYFTVWKESNPGQFYSLNDVTDNFTYFTVNTTCSYITDNLSVDDSIIGIIKGSESYNSGIGNDKTNYYHESVDITLTGYDFVYYFDASLNGYVIAMSDSFKQYILSLNDTNIDVVINLDNFTFGEPIMGIDLGSFGSVGINNLTILTEVSQDFYIYGNSRFVKQFDFSTNLTLKDGLTGGAYEQ